LSPQINHVSINARDLRESVDSQSEEQMRGRLFVP
jgi:hypothetical protein